MEKALEHGVGIKLFLCWRNQDCFLLPWISQVLVLIWPIQIVLPHWQSIQSHWLIIYRSFLRMKRWVYIILSCWSTLLAFVSPYLRIYVVLLQVILVGHSSGGACISYALEHFPQKISKAIFICATMVSNGQRPFDVFAEEVCNQYN